MSDIFREVDEDLRRERFKHLWERFGSYVIGLAVLIVVVTAGYRGWQYWQTSQAQSNGDRFVAALTLGDKGQHDQAIAALSEIVSNGSGAYPVLAAFRIAGEKAEAGDTTGAVAQYDSIASRGDVPPLVADMARLRAAMLLADSASEEELTSRIGNLAATGNPWRQSAREILGFAALRENDLTTARKYFQEIVDDQESGSDVRSRARMMLSLIDSRQGQPAAAQPGEG
jgi:hypothetical protein